MKKYSLFIACLFIVNLNQVQASPYIPKDKNINFQNVEKKAEGWKYFLNGLEVPYLPEIYVKGIVKYVPVEIVKNLGAEIVFDAENRTAYITNNEDTFIVKENSRQIYVNNKSFLIADEVIWKNNTLYVPIAFLSRFGVLISENTFKNELNILKSFNKLNDFISRFDNIENIIYFNLNLLPVYNFEKEKDFFRITFFGTAPRDSESLRSKFNTLSSYFKKIDFDNSKQGILILTFYPKTESSMINAYTLEKQNKLVVQIHQLFHHEERKLVKDGIYYSKVTKGDSQGPLKINILEINTNKGWYLKPEISRDQNQNFILKEVSKIAKDNGVLAAINGGFFSSKTQQTLGLLIINGELLSTPIYNRSSLVITKDGFYEVKNIDLNIHLKVINPNGNKVFKINVFNQLPGKNQISLFDYNLRPEFLNNSKVNEVKKNIENSVNNVKKDQISDIMADTSAFLVSKDSFSKVTDFESEVRGESFILFASGTTREELEKIYPESTGSEISFKYSEPLDNVLHAIGGGPTLVKNGAIDITAQQEKFKPDITEGRAPRTALAILKNNRILLVTVDGRQETSRGLSLEELAYFLKQYEPVNAINFDGGGSTTMYFNGEVVNSISDSKERKVSNALLLFKK